jgi:glycine/D-amino acid oxidase-like deaminating enzyme
MTHTVVVGAGIAGLWIALQLLKTGERVTILEKYGVPGGRIITSKHGYELGAGRVYGKHRRVRALLRHYGLHLDPLGNSIFWRPLGGCTEPNTFEETWSAILKQFKKLPPHILATHTLRDLAEKVLGADAARLFLERFPYRAELECQRADIGIRCFEGEMGTRDGYYVVREGLSAMIRGLVRDIRQAGGTLTVNTEVTDIERNTLGRYRIQTRKGKLVGEIGADRVVLAVHADGLRALPVTRSMPALSHLGMAPLTRIYAQYPGGWKHPRIVTDSPLRYIIPIDPATGVVMISYTDNHDTERFRGLKDKELTAEIQKEVRRLFIKDIIPEPLWVRSAEWKEGATYWRPGNYSPAHMSRAALQPRADMPELYCCGESFSVNQQAWMEGALEHAEQLWTLIQRKR